MSIVFCIHAESGLKILDAVVPQQMYIKSQYTKTIKKKKKKTTPNTTIKINIPSNQSQTTKENEPYDAQVLLKMVLTTKKRSVGSLPIMD